MMCKAACDKIYALLFSKSETLAQNYLKCTLHAQAPRQRADAVARIAQSLAEAYETVFCAMADSANGYTEQQGSSIALEHTPENVRMILGVLA